MRKRIVLLIITALVLVGIVVFAIWHGINDSGFSPRYDFSGGSFKWYIDDILKTEYVGQYTFDSLKEFEERMSRIKKSGRKAILGLDELEYIYVYSGNDTDSAFDELQITDEWVSVRYNLKRRVLLWDKTERMSIVLFRQKSSIYEIEDKGEYDSTVICNKKKYMKYNYETSGGKKLINFYTEDCDNVIRISMPPELLKNKNIESLLSIRKKSFDVEGK